MISVLRLWFCCCWLIVDVTPIVWFCLVVHSSFAIILMGRRELLTLLSLSFWCLVIVVWLFLVVPWVCPQFVIVVFGDHTHYFWDPIAQLHIHIYHIPEISEQSVPWLLRIHPDKICKERKKSGKRRRRRKKEKY